MESNSCFAYSCCGDLIVKQLLLCTEEIWFIHHVENCNNNKKVNINDANAS